MACGGGGTDTHKRPPISKGHVNNIKPSTNPQIAACSIYTILDSEAGKKMTSVLFCLLEHLSLFTYLKSQISWWGGGHHAPSDSAGWSKHRGMGGGEGARS